MPVKTDKDKKIETLQLEFRGEVERHIVTTYHLNDVIEDARQLKARIFILEKINEALELETKEAKESEILVRRFNEELSSANIALKKANYNFSENWCPKWYLAIAFSFGTALTGLLIWVISNQGSHTY